MQKVSKNTSALHNSSKSEIRHEGFDKTTMKIHSKWPLYKVCYVANPKEKENDQNIALN